MNCLDISMNQYTGYTGGRISTRRLDISDVLKVIKKIIEKTACRPNVYFFKWNAIYFFACLKSAYFCEHPHIGFAESIPSI